jgi:hypothetical protein
MTGGMIFAHVEATTSNLSFHVSSARVVEPGHVICLSRIDYQRIVHKMDDKAHKARKIELLRRILEVDSPRSHVLRMSCASASDETEDALEMLSACFAFETLPAGTHLGVQDDKAESLYIVLSGYCRIGVDLVSVKVLPVGADGGEAHQSRPQDRSVQHNLVNLAIVGKNTLIGVSDYMCNNGKWIGSYTITEQASVYKADMAKLMSVMSILENSRNMLQTLSKVAETTLRTWAPRLEQKFSFSLEARRMAGEGELVASASATSIMRLFSHPLSKYDSSKKASTSDSLKHDSLPSSNASSHKGHTDAMRRPDAELMSEFKAQLLSDDKSVVARIAAARAKDISGIMRDKTPVPYLNLNKDVVFTKARLANLVVGKNNRHVQTFRAKSPLERCRWGGIEMTSGAWLTERAPRSTLWLKPRLGEKFSENSSLRDPLKVCLCLWVSFDN